MDAEELKVLQLSTLETLLAGGIIEVGNEFNLALPYTIESITRFGVFVYARSSQSNGLSFLVTWEEIAKHNKSSIKSLVEGA